MEFQTLKKSHLKRNIIIGILVVGIISACILTFTRAKYKNTQSIPLVTGTINYSLADLNIVAIKVDGKEVETIPEGNYELTGESYCTVNGEKDESMKLSYDSTTRGLSVTPMTAKGTKCYLDFKERLCPDGAEACEIILANKEIKKRELPLTTSSTVEGDTTGKIYKAEDDWGDTYYFAGNPSDNWLYFAGYYWRIIRINGDGSIRVIYNGSSINTTGTGTQIQTSGFGFNSYQSEYLGYMYTLGQQHGNTSNSPIKLVIDKWYNSNLASYEDKISTEVGFCGDREMASGSSWSSTGSHNYAAYERLTVNSNSVNPTFKCSNSNDLYTTSSSSKGNKALTNPIGLITADEVIMAGLPWSGSIVNNYLYTNQYYWTMTPYILASDGWSYMFLVEPNGQLDCDYVNYDRGVRPVINLAYDVVIKSGNGTSSTPYEI